MPAGERLETFHFTRGNTDNRLIVDFQPGACGQCLPEFSVQALAMVQSFV
jgi:hypothetical protein